MEDELLERLAEAAHDVWVKGKVRDGWTYGETTDKANKIHSCLVPYARLSEADKRATGIWYAVFHRFSALWDMRFDAVKDRSQKQEIR